MSFADVCTVYIERNSPKDQKSSNFEREFILYPEPRAESVFDLGKVSCNEFNTYNEAIRVQSQCP